MKGYNLSEEYGTLWMLIHQSYRIPAWIVYSDEYEEPIYDLVEVKMPKYGDYSIGTRGISYSSIEDGEKGFIMDCKALKLKFAMPDLQLKNSN